MGAPEGSITAMPSPRGTMTARSHQAAGFLAPTPSWQEGPRGQDGRLPLGRLPTQPPDAPAQLTWLVCQGAFPGVAVRTVGCSRGGPALCGRRVLRLVREELSWLPWASEELRSRRVTWCARFTKSGEEPRPQPRESVGTETVLDAPWITSTDREDAAARSQP